MCSNYANQHDLGHTRRGEEPIRAINEHENFHFDYEEDIQMSSENYRVNGYKHESDLRIISH